MRCIFRFCEREIVFCEREERRRREAEEERKRIQEEDDSLLSKLRETNLKLAASH